MIQPFFHRVLGMVLVALSLTLSQWVLAQEPRILVTIAPLHSLVTSITEGITSPELLLAASASPHDFQLKPSQRRLISQSSIIIWVGDSLETPLANVFTSVGVTPFGLAQYGARLSLLPYRADVINTAAVTTSLTDDPSNIDPHFWLDPKNAIAFVETMVVVLMEVYPAQRDLLQQNAEQLIEALGRDAIVWQEALKPYQDQPMLSAHDGFQYFESAFGLRHVGALQLNAEVSMSIKRYALLRERISTLGVTCIFSEPQINPKQIMGLIAGLEAQVAILDPMGAGFPIGASLYRDMMQANVAAVTDCASQKIAG